MRCMEVIMQNRKKLLGIIGVIILLAVSVLGWYFLYFIKTPEYSLRLARDAYTQHNVQDFKKHVDVDSIIGYAYDDFVAVLMEDEKSNDSNLFSGFVGIMMQGLKPTVISTISGEIYKGVESGNNELLANSKNNDPAQDVTKTSGIQELEFKSVGESKKDGNNAILPITFTSKELGKDVIFDIMLRKLDDGTWQAFKINNFKDYMREMTKKQEDKSKQSASNTSQPKPSQAQLNSAVEDSTQALQNYYASITNKDFPKAYLYLSDQQRANLGFYDTWRNGYSTTISTTLLSANAKSTSPTMVQYTYRLEGKDLIDGRIKHQIFEGNVTMVKVNNNWVIQDQDGHLVNSYFE